MIGNCCGDELKGGKRKERKEAPSVRRMYETAQESADAGIA
jgi:hypothetical protein